MRAIQIKSDRYDLSIYGAARSNTYTVSNSPTVSSNPSQGMNVCPLSSVLCSPEQVKAMQWADTPPPPFRRSATKYLKNDSQFLELI
jgi:hypothetical protein